MRQSPVAGCFGGVRLMTYFDANATEPLRPEAREALLAALDTLGNPSSVHRCGRRARALLETAREIVARRFGGRPENLVLTSGGTEADALAVHGLGRGRRIIVGATEHDAIRSAAPQSVALTVDREGIADLDALAALLAGQPPSLVCLMLANNETGTIQPVVAAAQLCRRHNALLHVDAVQGAGRIPVDLAALGVDSLAVSSHKLGGPAGAGALLLTPEASSIAPLMRGGGQERGRRGGTPSVPAVAGFAAAALAASGAERLKPLRDAFERAAEAGGAVVCGAGAGRLPNTSCVALPGCRADAQVIALDLAGFAVSAGAACSSGKIAASHVLSAMGLGPLAGQAIRVSLPWDVTAENVEAFIQAYGDMAARLVRTVASEAG